MLSGAKSRTSHVLENTMLPISKCRAPSDSKKTMCYGLRPSLCFVDSVNHCHPCQQEHDIILKFPVFRGQGANVASRCPTPKRGPSSLIIDCPRDTLRRRQSTIFDSAIALPTFPDVDPVVHATLLTTASTNTIGMLILHEHLV